MMAIRMTAREGRSAFKSCRLIGDPGANVPRAVDDSNPGGLDLREKLHRRAVDKSDVLEIEGDATVRFVREKFLHPGGVLANHVST